MPYLAVFFSILVEATLIVLLVRGEKERLTESLVVLLTANTVALVLQFIGLLMGK